MEKNKMNRICSPEGIRSLMEDIWLRHESGVPQRENNVFFVDLPEPTEEEKEEMRRNKEERLACNEIDEKALLKSVEKLRGW